MNAEVTYDYGNGNKNGPFLISDDDGVLREVRKSEPLFFQKVPGHRREVISEYAGFLIVSHTRRYSSGQQERVTMAYLFDRITKGTLLVDYAATPAAMRGKIDRWWKGGTFHRDKDPMGSMSIKVI